MDKIKRLCIFCKKKEARYIGISLYKENDIEWACDDDRELMVADGTMNILRIRGGDEPSELWPNHGEELP